MPSSSCTGFTAGVGKQQIASQQQQLNAKNRCIEMHRGRSIAGWAQVLNALLAVVSNTSYSALPSGDSWRSQVGGSNVVIAMALWWEKIFLQLCEPHLPWQRGSRMQNCKETDLFWAQPVLSIWGLLFRLPSDCWFHEFNVIEVSCQSCGGECMRQ